MKLLNIFTVATTLAQEGELAPKSGGCLKETWVNWEEGETGFIQNNAMNETLKMNGYNQSDSCTWVIKSGWMSTERIMIRFNRFDTEDSKLCDDNDKNDSKGANSVFEMKFKDSENNQYHEKFCHTLGYDRWQHKNGQQRTIIKNFEGGNPKNFKVKNGENLMGWTEIDTLSVQFDFAVGPTANKNGQGNYKGFKIEYAFASDLTVEDLKNAVEAFVEDPANYPADMKTNRRNNVKKFFKQKIKKAHKQNAQKCVTTATHVPKFVKEAWESVTDIPELVAFLSHEEDKADKKGFKGYFDFVHAGCWRKIDSLENMARWNDKFVEWF